MKSVIEGYFAKYFGLNNGSNLDVIISDLLNSETKLMGVLEKKEHAKNHPVSNFSDKSNLINDLVGFRFSTLISGTCALIDSKIMSVEPSKKEIDAVFEMHIEQVDKAYRFASGLCADNDMFIDIARKQVFSGDVPLPKTETLNTLISAIGENMIIDLDGFVCLNMKVPLHSMPRHNKSYPKY